MELTPLTMAVWFMDDGSRSRRAVYLNTQQHAREEQERLIDMLKEQWELESSLNRDKTYFRIRISVESTRQLGRLLRPYMLPEFMYKLPPMTP